MRDRNCQHEYRRTSELLTWKHGSYHTPIIRRRHICVYCGAENWIDV